MNMAHIEGVSIKPLIRHVDDRGFLMEVLRNDEELYAGFGQAYIGACFAGVVKAWHAHEKQTDHFCVIRGNAKIGMYDDRPDSPTRGETMSVVAGELNPVMVRIPPRVWHGFKPVDGQTAWVLNIPSEPYNPEHPDELRRDPFDPDIPFHWETQSG